MSNSMWLDEKGFEFKDERGKEYLVRMLEGNAWLCYKHPDGQWVTLRKISQNEVWQFNMQAERQAEQEA